MTRHLDAVSVTEHRVVLALAREFADRAELAEAAIQRVRVMAEASIAAHDELEGTYATVSAKALLNALNGDSDE